MGRTLQDLLETMINRRFGRLLIVSYHGKNEHGGNLWKCQCDCGEETLSTTFILTSGNKKSCGCYRIEASRVNNTTHGLTGTRLHDIWCGMRSRCFNPNDNIFVHYGGRGVSICEEWYNNFEAFYTWSMKNGYRDDLTIDRYPNQNGNYEPTNCRWTTMSEQVRNRSITKLDENKVSQIKNDQRSSREIAESYGVSKDTVNKIRSGRVWVDID